MLDVDAARALITTSLSDVDLELVIAREESWLARRIGPLSGERVETFVTSLGTEVLELQRPTGLALVDDDDGAVDDYELRGWSDVVRTDGSWRGTVLVTYTPTDDAEVVRALITLVRLTVSESAYAAQSSLGYSATSDIERERRIRWSTWKGLLRPARPTTLRLTSVIAADDRRVGQVAVEPVSS